MTRRLPSVNITPGPEGAIMTTANHRPYWSGSGVMVAPEAYYRHTDGDDWGPAIQRALDAVNAEGKGTVVLGSTTYGWTGEIVVRENVRLVNNGGTLKALDATAVLFLGKWASGDEEPLGAENLIVDGDGTGDPDGLVRVQSVNGYYKDIRIKNSSGRGLVVDSAQNNTFVGGLIDAAGTDGLVLDNGAGGNTFIRFQCRSALGWCGVITDDPLVSNGLAYPWPSHNEFIHCIFETYVNNTGAVLIDAGGSNRFQSCGFSINGAVTASSGAQVRVSNTINPGISTFAEFQSCTYNGGDNLYTAIDVDGPNIITVTGDSYLQNSTDAFTTSATSVGHIYGKIFYNAVTNKFTATGGSFASWYNITELPIAFKLPSTFGYCFSTQRSTDAGPRFFIDRDGGLVWNDGTDFTANVGISYDAANNNILASGRLVLPSLARPGNTAFPAGGVTFSCVTQSVVKFILTGTGQITSMTVTDAYDGAILTIMVAADAGQLLTWAANMRFDGGGAGPASPAANNWLSVTFMYDSVTSKWIEQYRSTAPFV